jgi:prepilin-type N-terminal cleavage/methylation domain-containing protein
VKYGRLQIQAGNSLVEVLVCLVLMAVGMMAGLGMTKAAQSGLNAGRDISRAAALAQAKMEEEMAASYKELVHGETAGSEDLDGFFRTWTILPGTVCEHCASIRVTVEWPDPSGRLHHVNLAAVRSEGVVP